MSPSLPGTAAELLAAIADQLAGGKARLDPRYANEPVPFGSRTGRCLGRVYRPRHFSLWTRATLRALGLGSTDANALQLVELLGDHVKGNSARPRKGCQAPEGVWLLLDALPAQEVTS